MAEQENNNSNSFIKETVKQRPLDRKKLLRKTMMTALMAVIFGTVACVTFLVLEPFISKHITPEEKPQIVIFPTDDDEMNPEDMLAENIPSESEDKDSFEEEHLEEILSGMVMTKDNYKELYSSMAEYVQELRTYMVTVTALTSGKDWFNNMKESSNQTSGVVLLDNGVELLVLADSNVLMKAESLVVTFYNGSQAPAHIKQTDSLTGLAILAVPLDELPKEIKDEPLHYPMLGSSNNGNMLGMPVVAMGSPTGNVNSIGYGMIISASVLYSVPERNYKMLQTNIHGSENPSGVLFDLDRRIIGIITSDKTESDIENVISAYGITELRKILEKMSNGQKSAYLGISGMSVPKEVSVYYKVPSGGFVSSVDMDSPAMRAGIHQGDIICDVNGRNISTFTEYSNILMSMQPGDEVDITVKRLSQDEYKEIVFHMETGEVE